MEFVPLRRGPFYHLDTAMMVLPNGELMIHPGAVTAHAFARLQQAFQGRPIISVTEEEARGFPANLASVGNTLAPTRVSPGLRARLEELGYRVMVPAQVGAGIGR